MREGISHYWITIRIGKMAQKRYSIGRMLDDLYYKKDKVTMEEIEEVARIFGLKVETIIDWLHRHDPVKTD